MLRLTQKKIKFFLLLIIIAICFNLLYYKDRLTSNIIRIYTNELKDSVPDELITYPITGNDTKQVFPDVFKMCPLLKQVNMSISQLPYCTHKLCRLNAHSRGEVVSKSYHEPLNCDIIANCVTAILKTAGRHSSIVALINSAWKFYPNLKFIVTDDIFDPNTIDQTFFRMLIDYPTFITYKPFGYDGGLSAGRNVGFELSTTVFTLLLDDDFIFTEQTDLKKLVEVLSTTDLALVGGSVGKCDFNGLLRINQTSTSFKDPPILTHYSNLFYDFVPNHKDCVVMDVVKNFFLAKTKIIKNQGGWNERLKVSEHKDIFLKLLRSQEKIAFCPYVVIGHNFVNDEIRSKRMSIWQDYSKLFLRFWGLKQVDSCGQGTKQAYEELRCPFAA